MKKDRNCGMNIYPQVMPAYGGMVMPGSIIPMPNNINMTTTPNNYGNIENNLSNQINSLQERVKRLEQIINQTGYSNNYNSTNYQMM